MMFFIESFEFLFVVKSWAAGGETSYLVSIDSDYLTFKPKDVYSSNSAIRKEA